MSLTIEVTAGARSITFELRGDLDIAAAADLAEAMASVSDRYGRLILDLGKLGSIDSTGVRVLVQGSERLTKQGVKLELARVPMQAEKVFQLLGMKDWHRNEDIMRRISTDAPHTAQPSGATGRAQASSVAVAEVPAVKPAVVGKLGDFPRVPRSVSVDDQMI